MTTFAISNIRAGWVTAHLRSEHGSRTVVGSYTPSDSIRDFVDAVASLATTTSAKCSWNQEPEEVTWLFMRSGTEIRVIVTSKQPAFEVQFLWSRFAADVSTAMQTIKSNMGVGEYEREWRYPFPEEAC